MRFFQTLAFGFSLAVSGLMASTGAQAQSPFGGPLFAVLNGGTECVTLPAPQQNPVCRRGDLDGIGSATITFPTATTICWGINVDNIAGATLAHIHRGPAGVNGPVVVDLFPPLPNPPGGGNPGASAGCIAVAAALTNQIRNNPTIFYVNIHNNAFPGGAVRGQLH